MNYYHFLLLVGLWARNGSALISELSGLGASDVQTMVNELVTQGLVSYDATNSTVTMTTTIEDVMMMSNNLLTTDEQQAVLALMSSGAPASANAFLDEVRTAGFTSGAASRAGVFGHVLAAIARKKNADGRLEPGAATSGALAKRLADAI